MEPVEPKIANLFFISGRKGKEMEGLKFTYFGKASG
jgi:hypothetical protein